MAAWHEALIEVPECVKSERNQEAESFQADRTIERSKNKMFFSPHLPDFNVNNMFLSGIFFAVMEHILYSVFFI